MEPLLDSIEFGFGKDVRDPWAGLAVAVEVVDRIWTMGQLTAHGVDELARFHCHDIDDIWRPFSAHLPDSHIYDRHSEIAGFANTRAGITDD